MGKNAEPDNKPDFIRDLNTEIMDELTAGGLKGNAAGLAGELTALESVDELNGLPFCGYVAKIETPRPSGTLDEVVVAFTAQAAYAATAGIEFDILREFTVGSRIMVQGKIQTVKNWQSGKVLVFILAEYVAITPKAMLQDDVAICGVIANMPAVRTTPRGKRITDIFVKIKSELKDDWCYVPCICWQEQADEVAGWQQGDTVELLGRYQSREYKKIAGTLYADGQPVENEIEIRTAYEVSVQQIRRKEEAENGK